MRSTMRAHRGTAVCRTRLGLTVERVRPPVKELAPFANAERRRAAQRVVEHVGRRSEGVAEIQGLSEADEQEYWSRGVSASIRTAARLVRAAVRSSTARPARKRSRCARPRTSAAASPTFGSTRAAAAASIAAS